MLPLSELEQIIKEDNQAPPLFPVILYQSNALNAIAHFSDFTEIQFIVATGDLQALQNRYENLTEILHLNNHLCLLAYRANQFEMFQFIVKKDPSQLKLQKSLAYDALKDKKIDFFKCIINSDYPYFSERSKILNALEENYDVDLWNFLANRFQDDIFKLDDPTRFFMLVTSGRLNEAKSFIRANPRIILEEELVHDVFLVDLMINNQWGDLFIELIDANPELLKQNVHLEWILFDGDSATTEKLMQRYPHIVKDTLSSNTSSRELSFFRLFIESKSKYSQEFVEKVFSLQPEVIEQSGGYLFQRAMISGHLAVFNYLVEKKPELLNLEEFKNREISPCLSILERLYQINPALLFFEDVLKPGDVLKLARNCFSLNPNDMSSLHYLRFILLANPQTLKCLETRDLSCEKPPTKILCAQLRYIKQQDPKQFDNSDSPRELLSNYQELIKLYVSYPRDKMDEAFLRLLQFGYLPSILEILEHNFEWIYLKDCYGRCLAHVIGTDSESIKMLLSNNDSQTQKNLTVYFNDKPSHPSLDIDSSLIIASRNGLIPVVRNIIKTNPHSLEEAHSEEGLPIVCAASNHHFDLVLWMAEFSEDLSQRTNRGKEIARKIGYHIPTFNEEIVAHFSSSMLYPNIHPIWIKSSDDPYSRFRLLRSEMPSKPPSRGLKDLDLKIHRMKQKLAFYQNHSDYFEPEAVAFGLKKILINCDEVQFYVNELSKNEQWVGQNQLNFFELQFAFYVNDQISVQRNFANYLDHLFKSPLKFPQDQIFELITMLLNQLENESSEKQRSFTYRLIRELYELIDEAKHYYILRYGVSFISGFIPIIEQLVLWLNQQDLSSDMSLRQKLNKISRFIEFKIQPLGDNNCPSFLLGEFIELLWDARLSSAYTSYIPVEFINSLNELILVPNKRIEAKVTDMPDPLPVTKHSELLCPSKPVQISSNDNFNIFKGFIEFDETKSCNGFAKNGRLDLLKDTYDSSRDKFLSSWDMAFLAAYFKHLDCFEFIIKRVPHQLYYLQNGVTIMSLIVLNGWEQLFKRFLVDPLLMLDAQFTEFLKDQHYDEALEQIEKQFSKKLTKPKPNLEQQSLECESVEKLITQVNFWNERFDTKIEKPKALIVTPINSGAAFKP